MNQNANNPFGGLNTDDLEQSGDFLGGGGAIDSGIYTGTIKLAYAGVAKSGARSLTVHVDVNGREYRETLYVTSGTEKGCKNYYEKNGKKSPLPGFTTANDMALLSTGQPLSEQELEEKVVKLYDYDAKAEVPTKVQAVTSMMGKQITLGILKQVVDKNKKNDTTGAYEPTGETREENVIDKVFHTESGRTVTEVMAKGESDFLGKWKERNAGTVRDRSSGAVGKVGVPGQRAANDGGSAKAQTKSLFG
jgi:hypothetical protein